jgi:hypothetical protein
MRYAAEKHGSNYYFFLQITAKPFRAASFVKLYCITKGFVVALICVFTCGQKANLFCFNMFKIKFINSYLRYIAPESISSNITG